MWFVVFFMLFSVQNVKQASMEMTVLGPVASTVLGQVTPVTTSQENVTLVVIRAINGINVFKVRSDKEAARYFSFGFWYKVSCV